MTRNQPHTHYSRIHLADDGPTPRRIDWDDADDVQRALDIGAIVDVLLEADLEFVAVLRQKLQGRRATKQREERAIFDAGVGRLKQGA